ncbi:hypothetical protein AgCh_029469 [Apium graveolens]
MRSVVTSVPCSYNVGLKIGLKRSWAGRDPNWTEMGIPCVSVYSTTDKDALDVKLADELVCIGEASMLHPGYGFLYGNALFVEIWREHGINFFGPNVVSIIMQFNMCNVALLSCLTAFMSWVMHQLIGINEECWCSICTRERCRALKKAIRLVEEIGYPRPLPSKLTSLQSLRKLGSSSREKGEDREETELSLALEGGAEPPVVWCHLQLHYIAPKAKETLSPLHPGDRRITIEKAAHKYAETSKNPWGNMTPEQIQAAMDLWKEKNKAPETRPGDQEEHLEESRGSVFDRIGRTKRPSEDARDEIKRATLRDRIRKEEEAKEKANIEKRVQEEEAKLKKKTRRIHVSSDSEPEKDSKQEQMARVLRDLKRKVEGDVEVGAAATPFTRKLESAPREPTLKHFNFDSFDGLADPEEHLNYFEQISNIYDYKDLTKCRFFASTLKGGAQKWFSRISSRSIDSWKDFREIFLKRFRANRMNELQMCHLETIQQRSRETLPEFIKRFQESVNQLSNLEEKEAVNIFRHNLHPVSCEGYVKDLIHREPQSLASAYAMASKFIKKNDFLTSMKMNRRIRDDDESPERHSTYRKEKRHKADKQTNYVQQSRGTPPRGDYSRAQQIKRKPKPKREPKPEPEWTPLNRPRVEILREVKGKPFYYPRSRCWHPREQGPRQTLQVSRGSWPHHGELLLFQNVH